MKYLLISVLLTGLFFSCKNDAPSQKKPSSPHATAMTMVGDAHIHVDYSSPSVRGRVIFGELIPYRKLWRAGANNATWLESNKDLLIGGQTLPAGKYALFAIPDKDKWTIKINKNWDQHGTDDYQESEDALTLEVQPIQLEEIQEQLEYQVVKTDEQSGIISLAWEKTKVEIPFKVIL